MACQSVMELFKGSDRGNSDSCFSSCYDSIALLSHQEFIECLKSSWKGNPIHQIFDVDRIVEARKKHLYHNWKIYKTLPRVTVDQDGVYQWMNLKTLTECCQWISKMDLLAWDAYSDGCSARADYIGRLLYELKIPFRNLSKISIHSADHLFCFNSANYRYHTAILVKLKDQFEWVIDPLIDCKPIKIQKWLIDLGIDMDFVSKIDLKYIPFSFESIQWLPKTGPSRYVCKRIPINCFLAGDDFQPRLITTDYNIIELSRPLYKLCFNKELIALSRLFSIKPSFFVI
jgi:hypothetical protein